MSKKERDFYTEFRFTETVILQANGEYEAAKRIMRFYGAATPWFIRTELTLLHEMGVSQMTLEFRDTGEVSVISFRASTPDPLMNFDIRSLRQWTDANGWKPPEPSRYVISEMREFWKSMWLSHVINSPILDELFGERPGLDYGIDARKDDEEDDEDDYDLRSDDPEHPHEG